MLKSLGYTKDIFEDHNFLDPAEMQKVSAAGGGSPEEETRDCAVEGCKIECATSCNQCASGCHTGPN